MPHDRNQQLLKAGDKVVLRGTVESISSEQETYCNINMLPDEGMAPDVAPYPIALSARMVEKVSK